MVDPLRTKLKVASTALLAGTLGFVAAGALGWTSLTATPSIVDQPQVSEALVAPAVDLSNAFVNIAEAVTPSVVRIEAERSQRVAAPSGGGQAPFGDDLLRRFFPDVPPPSGGGGDTFERSPQEPQERLQIGGGSGFIVSSDGYILTNDHVVTGASRITVTLPDRRQYSAEVVGTDPTTDVAVLKIDDRNLPTMSFGSSEDVRVGEWVLAVGNPGFGGGSSLDYTVTAGIISAVGRPLDLLRSELQRQGSESSQYAIEDFIQTDAVINPGNSGGPLVNVRGQVIGINSAIASRTGYYQGYGFAIPIDLARRVMEDLVQYGQVRRPLLGVAMRDVTLEDAEYLGLPRAGGALVSSITEGTGAEAAGLQPEDVIVAIDGQTVDRSAQLQTRIAQKRPGERVHVRFYRDGRPQEVAVRLGEAPLQPQAERQARAEPTADERLGIQIGTDDQGRVVVRGVAPNGAAFRAGVVPGSRILAINEEPVESNADVRRILSAFEPGDVISFRLVQGENPPFNVRVRVPR
jgi:serine protease Do